MVGVRGRAEDRVNHGRLGPKGLYGWQGQLHDRLTQPMIRNGTTLVEASWDEAIHDLCLLASYLEMAWMVVGQAAKGVVIKSWFVPWRTVTKRWSPNNSGS
jgi:predicted molibdopterin-dependent oxidoreductase YjgC